MRPAVSFVTAFAPAKINLTLHVTGQRTDGYHLLDSLVVFADIGDTITADHADDLSLRVDGPNAAGVPTDASNLMIKAARLLDAKRGAALTLTKNLPPASGIGGGSSDAAATLRALSTLWKADLPTAAQVLTLGADLPVCMNTTAQRLSGIGDLLAPVPNLPACDILLVNPRAEVATPTVFAALDHRAHPPMPDKLPIWPTAQALADWLATQRNDLQEAAISVLPVIEDVLTALRETNCMFARMSGSGATCFAIFPPDGHSAKLALAQIHAGRPEWWAAQGAILTESRGI
jgi:4-diphosphocytidyl-2-C-methyl-D-erythritol kinase